MSTAEGLIEQRGGEAPPDLPALLRSLLERLNEPSTQERWYPGSSAATDTETLPYYRLPATTGMTDLLAAALIRPSGISFDFEDWLASFEQHSRSATAQVEARSLGRHLRLAFAGLIAGFVLALGLALSILSVTARAYRPDPYVAFAVLLGGICLLATMTVAIYESRSHARRRAHG